MTYIYPTHTGKNIEKKGEYYARWWFSIDGRRTRVRYSHKHKLITGQVWTGTEWLKRGAYLNSDYTLCIQLVERDFFRHEEMTPVFAVNASLGEYTYTVYELSPPDGCTFKFTMSISLGEPQKTNWVAIGFAIGGGTAIIIATITIGTIIIVRKRKA